MSVRASAVWTGAPACGPNAAASAAAMATGSFTSGTGEPGRVGPVPIASAKVAGWRAPVKRDVRSL